MGCDRLVVTASIGRTWNPHGEASVRSWAGRVGGELFIRNAPYEAEGQVVHPWHAKWDMVADAVEARRPEEVVWIDDDIVVRADADWPDYETWAALEVTGGRPLGGKRAEGALEIGLIRGIPWTSRSGYYNSGLVFRRKPTVAEFRQLGSLSRQIPPDLVPDQAALSVHLSVQTGVTRLPPVWHVRAPEACDGCLPGFINHFLGGRWRQMNDIGCLWRAIPRSEPGWAFPEVRSPPRAGR